MSKSFAAGFSLSVSLFISKIPVWPASNFSEYSPNFCMESISSGADSSPRIFWSRTDILAIEYAVVSRTTSRIAFHCFVDKIAIFFHPSFLCLE